MTRHRTPADQPAIVDDAAPVSPAHRPTWWTVRTVRWLAFCAVWLALALALVAVFINYRQAQTAQAVATATNRRLTALEEYVDGKGAERDRENAALHQQITQAICDLLDQLPAGGLLDTPRIKYGCGPGLDAPGRSAAPTAAGPAGPVARAEPSTANATAPAAVAAAPQVTSTPTPAGSQPSASPTAPAAPVPGLLCGLLPALCASP